MTPISEDPALWLQLIRSRRIGPVTFHRILAEQGGVEAALKALPGIARAAGVDDYALCPFGVVKHEMAQGRAARARLLLFGGALYPQALMDLADAPTRSAAHRPNPNIIFDSDPKALVERLIELVLKQRAEDVTNRDSFAERMVGERVPDRDLFRGRRFSRNPVHHFADRFQLGIVECFGNVSG